MIYLLVTLDFKKRVMLGLPGVSLISTRPHMPLLSLMDWYIITWPSRVRLATVQA